MGRILDACSAFLNEDEWPFEPHPEAPILKTAFKGQNGQYTCWFQERDEHQQMVFYSIFPSEVPEDKRVRVAEFLTRANYSMVIGNFEMDYSDGEVRYKTSADVEGTELPSVFFKNLIYANVFMMDRYLPGLMMVIFGGVDPKEAVDHVENGEAPEN